MSAQNTPYALKRESFASDADYADYCTEIDRLTGAASADEDGIMWKYESVQPGTDGKGWVEHFSRERPEPRNGVRNIVAYSRAATGVKTDLRQQVLSAMKSAELGMGSYHRNYDGNKLAHALQEALDNPAVGESHLLREALSVFDAMLDGCNEQKFGDYENGHGEKIGPRMDALHHALRDVFANVAGELVIKPIGTVDKVFAVYTCKGKGGEYELLGVIYGAGTSRGNTLNLYREVSTHAMYYRTPEDFAERMERIGTRTYGISQNPILERLMQLALVAANDTQSASDYNLAGLEFQQAVSSINPKLFLSLFEQHDFAVSQPGKVS